MFIVNYLKNRTLHNNEAALQTIDAEKKDADLRTFFKALVQTVDNPQEKDLTGVVLEHLKGKSLESALRNWMFGVRSLEDVTTLDLQGKGLTSIPKGILSQLPNLRTLNLANNDLKTLPDDIFNLEKLEVINLDGNQNLDPNAITWRKITRLPSIKQIFVPDNHAKIIEDVDRLTQARMKRGFVTAIKVHIRDSKDFIVNTVDSKKVFAKTGLHKEIWEIVGDYSGEQELGRLALTCKSLYATFEKKTKKIAEFYNANQRVSQALDIQTIAQKLTGNFRRDFTSTKQLETLLRDNEEKCKQFTSLDLEYLRLSRVPAVLLTHMPNLEKLYLEGNPGVRLPENVKHHKHLGLILMDAPRGKDGKQEDDKMLEAAGCIRVASPGKIFENVVYNPGVARVAEYQDSSSKGQSYTSGIYAYTPVSWTKKLSIRSLDGKKSYFYRNDFGSYSRDFDPYDDYSPDFY